MVLFGMQTHRIAMATATGVQALATDCEGHTPKAVVIEATGATVTSAFHARYNWGASDGTTTLFFGDRSRHSQATSDASRRRGSPHILDLVTAATSASVGRADFDSFATDEVNIDWTTAANQAYMMNVTVFYGDALEIALESHTHANSSGFATSITGLSFEPNLVMAWSPQLGFPDPEVATNDWMLHHGVAINQDSTITQGHSATRERDNMTITSATAMIFRNDSITSHITINSTGIPTFTGFVTVDSFNSDGITVSPSAAGMSFAQAYLLANVGVNKMLLSFQDINTAISGTGTAKKIVTDWKPKCGRILGTGVAV